MEIKEIRFCVCQDCDNIVPFSADRHNDVESCECGGQFCGCNFCNLEYASHLNPKLVKML